VYADIECSYCLKNKLKKVFLEWLAETITYAISCKFGRVPITILNPWPLWWTVDSFTALDCIILQLGSIHV